MINKNNLLKSGFFAFILLVIVWLITLIFHSTPPTNTKFGNINHIVMDHTSNTILGIDNNGNSKNLISNIALTTDDTILNQQAKYLLLQHYLAQGDKNSIESYVFQIESNSLKQVFFAKGQKIYSYTDSSNYSYTTGNSSYAKYNGKDNKIFTLTSEPYYLGNPTVENTTFALNSSGSGVEQYDNKTGEHINDTGFSGAGLILTYFAFSSSNEIYSGINQSTNSSFIDLYPPFNTNKNTSNKLIKEIVTTDTPTILSPRGSKLYFSCAKGSGVYTNYYVDLSTYKVYQIKDFTASQELLY